MNGEIKDAVKAGVPIFIAYIPPAIAFGILSKTCSISLFECFLFSKRQFFKGICFNCTVLSLLSMGRSISLVVFYRKC